MIPASQSNPSSEEPQIPQADTRVQSSDFPTRTTVEAQAAKYQLALPERQRASRMGELSGRRTGSSVEYQDRKDFTPGDDLRHVDWRGFARSDRMTVKLYREEITPSIDIVIDASASMAVTSAKALRRLELSHFFWVLARKLHASIRTHAVGEHVVPLIAPIELRRVPDVRLENPLPVLKGSSATRRGGIKIFLTDLLFPVSPADLTRTFADADRLIVIQITSAFENDPGEGISQGSMIRLEDAELEQHLDIRLDATTIAGYKSRLNALRRDVDQQLRLREGAFASVSDDTPLDEVMRNLLALGIITV